MWSRYEARAKYWREHPPVHIILGVIAEGLGVWKRGGAAKESHPDTMPVRGGSVREKIAKLRAGQVPPAPHGAGRPAHEVLPELFPSGRI